MGQGERRKCKMKIIDKQLKAIDKRFDKVFIKLSSGRELANDASKNEIKQFLSTAIKEAVEEDRKEVEFKITRLDWIKILSGAIKMRPTSWGKDVVREWRNASDEIWGSLMLACYKAGIFEDWPDQVRKQQLKNHKEVK